MNIKPDLKKQKMDKNLKPRFRIFFFYPLNINCLFKHQLQTMCMFITKVDSYLKDRDRFD